MAERLGRLSDLELWRDIRESKIEDTCTREPTQCQGLAAGAPNFLWAIKPLQGQPIKITGFIT